MAPHVKAPTQSLELVLDRLSRSRELGLWPQGPRDLWADALGVICLLSLYREMGDPTFLQEAEWVAQHIRSSVEGGRKCRSKIGKKPKE